MNFRTSCLWFGCAALLLFAGCNRGPLTLDDVIARNADATGGRAAIEAVKSLQIELHIVDPGFAVDGIYRAARPGSMRIDITAEGKRVFSEAFNGERAWIWQDGAGDPADANAMAKAGMQHGVELPGKLFGLHEAQSRGEKLELSGRETVDAIEYYVVKMSFTDGYVCSLYIDPESWLITRRRDNRALHPDADPTPTVIETRSSDFREINGVVFPFSDVGVDLATGKELERTTVKSITVNPPIDPQIFEKL